MTKENKQELLNILVERIRSTARAYSISDNETLTSIALATRALIELEKVEIKSKSETK